MKEEDWVHPLDRSEAHLCSNGKVRPYSSFLCSGCHQKDKVIELSIREMVDLINGIDNVAEKIKKEKEKIKFTIGDIEYLESIFDLEGWNAGGEDIPPEAKGQDD